MGMMEEGQVDEEWHPVFPPACHLPKICYIFDQTDCSSIRQPGF